MRNIFKAFAKKLFGAKYERLKRAVLVYPAVFWGLYMGDFQIRISAFILYLMVSAFTAGAMWQALSSGDNREYMKNMFMLPFKRQEFVFSYVSALGTYTLLTKTAGLFAVVTAVSSWSMIEILGSILCGINAILMAACIYPRKKYWYVGLLWTAAVIAGIFLIWDLVIFLPMITGNILLAIRILWDADAYSFYMTGSSRKGRTVRNGRHIGHYFVWRYLFRYLTAHKNYLVNTVVMWGVSCVLPMFLGKMENVFVMPIGFAILSLNTPICILLSCDPALEQALRCLPGQERSFCIPYCLFIFLCNIAADVIFLWSWQIRFGGVTGAMALIAVSFAFQSAVGSLLLEWFLPIRGWKIESDLWNHPRKYLVPAVMLLIGGAVGAMPEIMPVLLILLMVETMLLTFLCWRC